MATIKEAFDGMHQTQTAESREYTVKYLVKGYAAVSEFPAYFTWQGVTDPYARLTGLTTGKQLGPMYFEITANYSTLPKDNAQKSSNKDQPANPLIRSVKRSWGTGYVEKYQPCDLDDIPYATSAGEAFAGGLPIRYPYLIKRYTRNEAYFSEEDAEQCIYHTDAAKLVLCTKFDGSEQMEDNGVVFVEVSYEFWCIKPSSELRWEEVALDVGSYYVVNDVGYQGHWRPVFPQDAEGQKALIPGSVFLDGAGGPGSKDTPEWLTFKNYETTSFASLGLPGI
jgi:hypothetical protein